MVAACRLEGGEGVGQRRILTLIDGSTTISRLDAIDPTRRTLTYRILETKLPLRDYTSTMAVVPQAGTETACEVIWVSHFRPRDATLAEARSFLEGALGASVRDLRDAFAEPVT